PQGWLDLFSNGDTRNLLMEYLHVVLNTRRINKAMDLTHADGHLRTVAIDIAPEGNDKIMRFSIKPPDPRQIPGATQLARLTSLDTVVIDLSLIPSDIDAFVTSIREGVQTAGLKSFPDGPRVIVIAHENQTVPFEKLLKAKVFGLVYRPIEI